MNFFPLASLFFLPPFSKLPLFRRKLQKSLAFLPRHALANLQMRFLSRALSRSTTSIFVPLVIQPTNNFPSYLLIFFLPRNAPLSNTFLFLSHLLFLLLQFSFLRSSPPFFRCPSIFSSFLCLTEECRVLKREGMIASIKKLSFFLQFNSVKPQEFFYISPLFLFSLLPSRWISWNLVVETNGSLKQMWQKKKIHAYFSTSETMDGFGRRKIKERYLTQLRSMTFHFWKESNRVEFFFFPHWSCCLGISWIDIFGTPSTSIFFLIFKHNDFKVCSAAKDCKCWLRI